jgi:GNAT superfamily N-acetyltransferase
MTSGSIMKKDNIKLRPAGVADLPAIMRHRRCMFREMGFQNEADLDAMEATSAPFIKSGLIDGTYRGWLAEGSAGVVAGGGMVIAGFPSTPFDPQPRRVWILNMYTEPEHRGQGLARRIMEAMIAWCREEGLAVVALHASEAGRPLYEHLGFIPTNEMRLKLK